jgi:hypothetical protein
MRFLVDTNLPPTGPDGTSASTGNYVTFAAGQHMNRGKVVQRHFPERGTCDLAKGLEIHHLVVRAGIDD